MVETVVDLLLASGSFTLLIPSWLNGTFCPGALEFLLAIERCQTPDAGHLGQSAVQLVSQLN